MRARTFVRCDFAANDGGTGTRRLVDRRPIARGMVVGVSDDGRTIADGVVHSDMGRLVGLRAWTRRARRATCSSHRTLHSFLEYLGIPYRVADVSTPPGFARLQAAASTSRSVLWRRFDDDGPERSGTSSSRTFRSSVASTRNWYPTSVEPLHSRDCLDGDELTLPFDPGEVMLSLWSEAYLPRQDSLAGTHKAGGCSRLLRSAAGDAARPSDLASPPFQRRFRLAHASRGGPSSRHSTISTTSSSPASQSWPRHPVPWIAPWPAPYRWAIVLSHDVEHELGYDDLHLLADVELELGYTSSWNFVPERDYEVGQERLDQTASRRLRDRASRTPARWQRPRVTRDPRATASHDEGLRRTLGCRGLPVAGHPQGLGAHAVARHGIRLVLARHRSLRAEVRRLLHVVAVLQSRPGGVARHRDAGSHGVRDPRATRRCSLAREGRVAARLAAGWRSCSHTRTT